MGIVKEKTVVKARRIKIRHLKDIISSSVDKAEAMFQNEINSYKLLNANKKLSRLLSSSLAMLADFGVRTILEEDFVTFVFLDKELRFSMPNSSISLFNIVELMRQSVSNRFEVLPFSYSPITSKYILLSENLLKLYDGTQFYLESIDPTVITETYFLKTHDNFPFRDKIVPDIEAAFGDTAIWIAKQDATVLAVGPANFEWFVRNLELNKIGSDKVVPLNMADGIDGLVEIERVSSLSFDYEARIHGVNGEHSKEKVMVPGSTIKNIVSEDAFDSVDYLKSDCKECESFFSFDNFSVIKRGVEIECSAYSLRSVLKVLKSSGFETAVWNCDTTNHESLNDNETIVARRVL